MSSIKRGIAVVGIAGVLSTATLGALGPKNSVMSQDEMREQRQSQAVEDAARAQEQQARRSREGGDALQQSEEARKRTAAIRKPPPSPFRILP